MDLFLQLESTVQEVGIQQVVQTLAEVAARIGGSDMADWVPVPDRGRWIETEGCLAELGEALRDLWDPDAETALYQMIEKIAAFHKVSIDRDRCRVTTLGAIANRLNSREAWCLDSRGPQAVVMVAPALMAWSDESPNKLPICKLFPCSLSSAGFADSAGAVIRAFREENGIGRDEEEVAVHTALLGVLGDEEGVMVLPLDERGDHVIKDSDPKRGRP